MNNMRLKNPWPKVLIALALFLPLKATFEISRVQDYRGGKAYISLSPDGQYKALRIYVEQERQNKWGQTMLAVGGYKPRLLFAITDASTGEMLAFYHPPIRWVSDASGGSWTCGERGKDACTAYSFPYSDDVQIPPSWWQRTHAKLTVKIKGLENPEFKNITVYE